jgi:hypothetical protein
MGAGTSLIATQGLTVLKQNVQGSITTLRTYETSDPDARKLITKYTTLSSLIDATKIDISGADANIIVAKQSSLNAETDELDQEKAVFLNKKGITTVGFLQIVSYYLGMLFAVIIITNKMLSENWLYKMYYAIWGAVFYPLVLVWGIIDPPRWKALLIPLAPASSGLWYVRYIVPFVYTEDPKGTLPPDKSRDALRIFTVLIALFWGVLQFIPANWTT